jgi:hypothetical protein
MIEPCDCAPCRIRRRSEERARIPEPIDRIVFDNDWNAPIWLRVAAMVGTDEPCAKESK